MRHSNLAAMFYLVLIANHETNLMSMAMCKYVVVVGGVISGCGKGISSASIGLLLSMRGIKVVPIKMDGYLNTNAGVLSPREHGEVFLCDDGSETDLDLGTYERLIGCQVSKKNILTLGSLYKELIEEEESGKYLGETVQVSPHLTEKVIGKLTDLGKDTDVVIVEIGGTIGDVESSAFLEAVRQFKQRHWNDVMIVLVAPILWIPTIKEFKTKPLQQSVKELQSFGLQPDLLLCRVDRPLEPSILGKVANLTNVPRGAIFDCPDVETIHQVPIEFYNRHIDDLIIDKFQFMRNGVRIHKYRELVEKYVSEADMPDVNVGIIGKYHNEEAYLSLKEAIYHAAVSNNVRANLRWISAEELEQAKDMRGVWSKFDGLHSVIVPGGFDCRGVEGKIKGIKYVREKKIPFLGICLGLQCAVIEYFRNQGLTDANSEEFNPKTEHPVIHYIKGQESITKKSGTMRLGSYECELSKDSIAYELYKKKVISERHRHRYEVNPFYAEDQPNFKITGRHPNTGLIEIMELDRSIHPFFIGTQSHPEFKSRLISPAPLFNGLIQAAIKFKSMV
jgi:CTP synthase